jgi:hypothetical protein
VRKREEGAGFFVAIDKISGKGPYTLMRIQKKTQQFAAFVQDLHERFWGHFQGRAREALEKLLEADSEQQMAEYLGLKWHERAAAEAGASTTATGTTNAPMSRRREGLAFGRRGRGCARFCRGGCERRSGAVRK